MNRVDSRLIGELLTESLGRGLQPVLTISSGSMRPLLRRGDEVIIENAAWEGLVAGDIIVLRRPAALFTHRFWGTVTTSAGAWLTTRGDRSASFDRPVLPEAYVGRVAARRRNGRILFLDSGPGARANRRLTRLGAQELGLLARLLHRPALAALPSPTAAPLNYSTIAGRSPFLRLVRALYHLQAHLLLLGVRTAPAADGVRREERNRQT